VIDLWSRRVVGWSMSVSPNSELVTDALLMAFQRRKNTQPLETSCPPKRVNTAARRTDRHLTRRNHELASFVAPRTDCPFWEWACLDPAGASIGVPARGLMR
jgi:hypothetical protein